MDHEVKRLFVGIKVSPKLQRELDNCRPETERYYKEDTPESLQIVTFGEEKVIGRFLQDGYPVANIDNVSRNIRSIVRLITGGSRIEEDSVRIYASRDSSISREHSTEKEHVGQSTRPDKD